MFNNVALDVFIGLVFIFLLYSLLATIIMEFIAHALQMRQRLLVKALRRMLEDNPPEVFGRKHRLTFIDFFSDTKEAIKRYFAPFRNLHFLQRFYYHPTIKYLGESRSSSKPSYMHGNNFSQTIIQLFRSNSQQVGFSQIASIQHYLFVEAVEVLKAYKANEHWIVNDFLLEKNLKKENITQEALIKRLKSFKNSLLTYDTKKPLLDALIADIEKLGSIEEVKNFRNFQLLPLLIKVKQQMITADTLRHFQNLYIDAQSSLDNFRQKLELWFDETMERTSGWYKRQTQIILLCLGLFMAIWANVDTIKIYKTLAKDKNVRDQMVTLALQANEKYQEAVDTIRKIKKDTTTTVIQKDTTATNTDTTQAANGNDTIVVQTKLLTTGNGKLDSTYKVLQGDVAGAQNIMGLGWCNSDSCKFYLSQEMQLDSLEDKRSYYSDKDTSPKTVAILKSIDSSINRLPTRKEIKTSIKMYRDPWNGWSVVGWIITALAISLGAPFWFDLLNKLVKLRSSGAKVTTTTNNDKDSTATVPSAESGAPVTVNVSSNANAGEEAVG